MTRKLLLAALAFACLAVSILVPAAAFAGASTTFEPDGGSGAHALVTGLTMLGGSVLFAALAAALIARLRVVGFVLATLVAYLVYAAGPAFAQVTTTPSVTPAVVIPYGEYVVAVAQLLSDILVPLFVAVIMGLLAKFYPMARMLLSEALVERTLRKWFDFGVNATAGAVKDGTVTVPIGSEIVAKALQRGVNRADVNAVSKWTMDQAGGPEEVANKLFRMLKLDQGASASDVVAPALAALPVK